MSTESNQFRHLLRLLHDDEDFEESQQPINRQSNLPGSKPRHSTLQMDDDGYDEADYSKKGSTSQGSKYSNSKIEVVFSRFQSVDPYWKTKEI